MEILEAVTRPDEDDALREEAPPKTAFSTGHGELASLPGFFGQSFLSLSCLVLFHFFAVQVYSILVNNM